MHDANLGRNAALAAAQLRSATTIGARERMQNRHRIAIDIFVDVGATQSDDKRPMGVTFAKIPDAVGAAPCVERDHQIWRLSIVAVGNLNFMAELAQDPRPSGGRGSIPGP